MSVDRLINGLKGHMGAMDGTRAANRIGVVQSYDPARHVARVTLQPEGVNTGWLPVATVMCGPGWGLASPLYAGMQVLCVPQEGDGDSYHIVGGVFSSQALPPTGPSAPSGGSDQNGNTPTNAQPGEVMLISKAGAVLRLCADGSIYFKGTIHQDGDLHVNGDLFDRHGSLDRLRGNYNSHVHLGVQIGSANTQPTAQTDPE